MGVMTRALAVFLCIGLVSCSKDEPMPETSIDDIGEAYVALGLRWGQIEAGYVDAFYGPAEWQTAAEKSHESNQCATKAADCTAQQRSEADALLSALDQLPDDGDDLAQSRRRYLSSQLKAMQTRMDMREGAALKFDDESLALYGAKAPRRSAAYFQEVLQEINDSLPGDGSISERVNEFRERFVIPKERLSAVFDAAIAECQRRTKAFIQLPEGERFQVEYVTDKPWSGYNWYQGDYYSLIQVNTDLPIFIDRAVDLGCHEGYPGHHTYNVLLEKELVNERGWREFTMYPLFSPQSLIAEGSANYGIQMAFPGRERLEFEKRVLFPMAGLDPDKADEYFRLTELLRRLNYSGNEAARNYLNGDWTRERAEQWLVDYALSSPERAAQRVRFFDTYRAYVINYNLGRDIVADYVQRQLGNGDDAKRWQVFGELLASPKLPADLIQ